MAVNIPFFSKRRARRREIEQSDWGRRYGWTIEQDGKTIGELEYVRWDADSQFWHDYRVTWCNPDAASSLGAAVRGEVRLTLRNRRYPDVVCQDFFATPKLDGIVAVRGASVPEQRFDRV
jgi:hypothetical protein